MRFEVFFDIPIINALHHIFDRFALEVALKDCAVEDEVQPLGLVPHLGVLVLEVDDAVLGDCKVHVVIGICLIKSLQNTLNALTTAKKS